MPLKLYNKIAPEGEIGIWTIQESEEFFLSKLDLRADEFDRFSKMKGRRRVEWLGVRYLLHYMSGRDKRGAILKDEFGKPHLEGADWHISISHTDGKAAAIASPKIVGIDIQKFVPRIDRIAHKFMRDVETSCLHPSKSLEHLHIFWGAKESLYKAYGRKELDFKDHIYVTPFQYENEKGQTKGRVVKGEFDETFTIHYDKLDNFFLVWVVIC